MRKILIITISILLIITSCSEPKTSPGGFTDQELKTVADMLSTFTNNWISANKENASQSFDYKYISSDVNLDLANQYGVRCAIRFVQMQLYENGNGIVDLSGEFYEPNNPQRPQALIFQGKLNIENFNTKSIESFIDGASYFHDKKLTQNDIDIINSYF